MGPSEGRRQLVRAVLLAALAVQAVTPDAHDLVSSRLYDAAASLWDGAESEPSLAALAPPAPDKTPAPLSDAQRPDEEGTPDESAVPTLARAGHHAPASRSCDGLPPLPAPARRVSRRLVPPPARTSPARTRLQGLCRLTC